MISLLTCLGRYAALLALPIVGAVGYVWLLLLDIHPYAAMGLAFVVVPLLTAASAIALGVVFMPGRSLPRDRLSRAEAPRLWALWDEIDPPTRRRRVLAVDDMLNASMAERRGPFGLGRAEILTLGVPLLMTLDEPALRAVVAHEAGHARLSHASGLANLVDFVDAFDMLFLHVDPDNTVTGAIAYAALHGGMRRLKRRERALSRRHELEADAFSAERKSDMARALVLLEAAFRSHDDLIAAPIRKELLESVGVPEPPLARTLAQLPEIHRRGVLETALMDEPEPSDEFKSDEALYGSTHPSFRERLESLGFPAPPVVTPVTVAASVTLLAPELVTRLVALFDARWTRVFRRDD